MRTDTAQLRLELQAQASELEHQKQLLAHRDVELRLKTDAQLKVEAELEATTRRLKEEQGARADLRVQGGSGLSSALGRAKSGATTAIQCHYLSRFGSV